MKREKNEAEKLAIEVIAKGVFGRTNLDEVMQLINMAFIGGYVAAIGDAMQSNISSLNNLLSEEFSSFG